MKYSAKRTAMFSFISWVVQLAIGMVRLPIMLLGDLMTWIADKLGDAQFGWLVAMRLAAGLTRAGKTPMQVAEEDQRRERILAEMRSATPATGGKDHE